MAQYPPIHSLLLTSAVSSLAASQGDEVSAVSAEWLAAEGWQVHRSARSGCHFYHHRASGHSQYDLPRPAQLLRLQALAAAGGGGGGASSDVTGELADLRTMREEMAEVRGMS